uniref:neuroblast differentiation-associated protein AHNAK isoform X5 n=1 Tax=Epinephelus lanceolatus TaxID=310571 RepID=UPI0014471E88|nr:neuroblast differentiation-associated protein AHNAK isoform X5 [Epinephelus lanceolatus]
MAEEEETREVLFPDWEGPDKTGLTIEQTSGGELFVKEVKGESPAARSGKVYEGDQIVGATVYFDNMSSEETAELLKTLNRHKVGLKLQNKSPCCSPVSTPCRSPIGTLTWEGKTRFGGSSPDIILSGEDEDYKRIYTKKIKPRLKSEDLAEGVDVRTERHSSTSSDGSTITTITRRITTYTVDMPGGISEQLELSSPEFKGLQQESGDGTSYIRISHGSPSGNVKPEEGVFESSNVSVSGPQVSTTETRWSSGGVQIKTTTREVERDKSPGLGFKGSNFGPTGAKGQGDFEILRGSGEQGDRNIQLSGISKTLRDSTNTGSKYVTIGGLVGGEVTSTDENGGSISMSLPGKSMQILTSSTDKTQERSVDASSGERTKVKVSEEKGSGSIDLPNVRLGGGSIDSDAELRGGRIGGTTTTGITVGNVASGYSSRPGKISVAGVNVNLTGSKLKGEVDVNLPSTKGGIKSSRIDTEVPGYEYEEVRKPEADIRGIDTQIRGPSSNIEGPVVSVRLPEADFKAPEINSSIQTNVPKSDSKYKVEVSKVKIPSLSGPDTDLNLKSSKAEGGIDVAVLKPEGELKAPKIDIKGPAINIEGEEGDLKMPQIKIRSYGAKGPRVDIKAPKAGIEAPEVDGEGVKFKMPSKTGPTMPESDISLKGSKVKVEMDVSVPKIERHTTKPEVETNINVKAPGVDIHRADAKFNIPTISGTKISMPSVDFSQRGPEIKGDVDVSAPKIERDIKTPGVDIKGPKSGFGIKTPKMEGTDVDVKLPKTNIDVKAPEFDIKGPGIDIEGPETKIRGPEFKLPSMSGLKLPDVDMSLEGPTITGDIDVSVPEIVGEMKTPEVKIEGQDVDIEGRKGEFKMPKFSKPSLGIKGPKVQGHKVDVSLPKADIDIKAPEVDITGPHIKTPELDIKGPSVHTEDPKGGFEMPKIKMPTFDSKGPKVEGPDVDINLPKGGIDVKMPEVDVKAPKVDIEGPDLDIEGPKGGFKMPKFGLPKFGLKGPKVEGPEVDVSLPKADIDIKAPEVDIKGPDLDIEGPSGKIKGPKFSMPKISGPKLSMPDVDFNLRGPNLKGDVDVSVPKIEGDIKTPELDIKGPQVDIKGPKGGFEMPKIQMPTFDIKGPKVEGPDVDINLPKGGIDVKMPEVDMKAPKVDIEGPDLDIEGPKGGFKMPKFGLPKFGLKGPKVEGPEVDVSLPKADIDIKAPEVDIKGPDLDIESPSGKIKGPKFSMPKISGPKLSMPDVDFNLRGPNLKGDVDVSVPKIEGDIKTPELDIKGPQVDIKGPKGGFEMPKIQMPTFDIKGPKVEGPDVDINLPKGGIDVKMPEVDMKAPKVDIEGPDLDIEGPKGGFKMPKFGLPKFGLKGPKVEGPEVDVSLPKADIDIKAPEVDIKGPDLDIEGPSGKIKGPKFSMPKISGPKLSMPDVDFNLRGPNLKGDVDVSVPKIEGDIKTPELDIKGPQVDIKGPKGGFEMPKIQMPTFDIKGPKVEGPDVDINLPKGGIDVKMPEVDMKAPKVDIEGPDLDIEGPKGGFKMPKFGLPKFGLKGPKVEGPDVDINLPKGGIDVKMPEVDMKAPKVDIEGPDLDIEGPKGGFHMPKFGLPKFGLKGPKVEGPEVDVSLPKADIDIKAPEVDIKGPDLDIEGPSGKIKGPKFNMPKISGPKLSMPDVDFNLRGPNLKGDVDVSVPKIEGDIKTPEFDIKGPQVDIKGPKGGFEMPKIKMPTFDIKGPKVEGPDVDINLPKGGIDVKMPEVDIKTPKVDIEGPDLDIEGSKGGFHMPKFGLPKFGLKGSKVEGPEVDVSLPKADIDIKAPEVDIKGPDLDIESPSGKIKGPKFSMPKISGPKLSMPDVDFNLRGPNLKGDLDVSVPKIEGDIKTPEFDIKGPQVDIKGPKGGLPKIQMPTFDMKGPKVEGHLPKGDIKVQAPDVDIKGPEVDIQGPKGGFEIPKIKMPSISGPKMPDVDISLKGPRIKGDISAPKIEGDIKTPEGEIKVPNVEFEIPEGELSGPKVKLPKVSGPKITLPDVDINLKGPKLKGDLKGDVQLPKTEIEGPDVTIDVPEIGTKKTKFKLPKFGFKGPKVKGPETDVKMGKGDINIKGKTGSSEGLNLDLGISGPKSKGSKFKMPKFSMKGSKVEMPDVDVSLPKADIDIKAPEVDIKGPDLDIEGPSGKIKGPKFNMPKISGPKLSMSDVDFKLRGPSLKGDVDVSVPKIEGDIKTPELNIKCPSVDIEGPQGGFEMPKIKMPSVGLKGPKLEGPSVDINLPKSNIDVKAPHVDYNLKGKMDASAPKLDADIKGPNTNIAVPTITMEGLSVDPVKTGVTFPKFKGPKFGMKSPEVEGKTPTFSVGVKGPKTEVSLPDNEASLDAPDININVKGKKGKFKLPKGKGKVKKPDVDIETPAVDLDVDTPHIHVKGTKVKKPLFGKLHFPDVELDIKSPKLKGDGSFSEGFRSPDTDFPSASLNTAIEGSGIGGPNVNVSTSDIDANLNRQGEVSMSAGFKGPKINVKGSAEVDASASGGSASGGLHYPEGTVTFPKIKVPKFGIALPQLEGQGHGGNVESASGGINIQSPSVSCQVSSQNIEVPSPELRHSEGKVKVKMPKLFGKSKAKGSSAGDLRGPEVELSTSGKGGKVHAGELMGGKLELEGDPGLSVSTKSKSASLDLFQRSRHRSSSDEGGLAGSSPSAHLEAEGGDISLDLGGSKAKGKKGKLKFGTFGGFGSKSKGSYEVSLGEESEAGVSLPSKKSRLSSSSSSDSGSRGGFRFPRLELSVSPKK